MGKKSDISNRKKGSASGSGLKLVDGGLRPPTESRIYEGGFVMAEVTDTRLMGVIGIHVVRSKGNDTIHQFFYLDSEEYGLDEYTSVVNCGPDKVEAIKRERFGALGGSWSEIDETEAAFLIIDFINFTLNMGLSLPEPKEEYLWYRDLDIRLSNPRYEALWAKLCVPIRNDNELINYFLMRCTGLDSVGAKRLSTGVDTNFIGLRYPATLFRNSITKSKEPGKYFCTMLIDDGAFRVTVAEIIVEKGKVVAAKVLSDMDVTPWEASIILRREEYVIYNRFDGGRKVLDNIMSMAFDTLTSQDYEVGTLYMIFNKNNDHVQDPVYRLDRDTMAAVLMLDTGELVVAGDDPDKTGMVENIIVLGLSALMQPVTTVSSYRFGEQVVGAFLDSDFYDFKEFLEYIQSFEEK